MSTTLILLVPLLILPVVLLLAFAGCQLLAPLDPHESAPQQQDPNPPPAPPSKPPPVGLPPTTPTLVSYEDLILHHTPGLVAYWRLGDPAASPSARDSGPNGLDGTYYGGVNRGTSVGALALKESGDLAAAFNGTNGFVEVKTPQPQLLAPSSFSVEAWVFPQGDPNVAGWVTEQYVVSSHGHASGVDYGFELKVIRERDPNAGVQGLVYTGLGSPSEQSVALSLSAGPGAQWRYLVMTYNGVAGTTDYKTLRLYVDAVEVQPPTSGATYAVNLIAPLRIGAGRQANGNPDKFFNGLIDEVALYNVALDENIVKDHFAAAK